MKILSIILTLLLACSITGNLFQRAEANRRETHFEKTRQAYFKYAHSPVASTSTSQAPEEVLKFNTFRLSFLPEARQMYVYFPEKLATDQVAYTVAKLEKIKGVTHVAFAGGHEIRIERTRAFKWDELKEPIIEVLKSDFPDQTPESEASPTPSSAPTH